MKPVQNEGSFSQMSKYKEGISEAKEKKMYWEMGLQQFYRDFEL